MNSVPPDALLLLTSSCPFCPNVLKGLSELVKSGDIGRLEVVNIEQHPEVAQAHNVRSVPWVKIGIFELGGSRSPAELRQWTERAGTIEGKAAYVGELLVSRRLPETIELVKREPVWLDAIVLLAADTKTDLQVRLGIGAVLEELRGNELLARLVEPLASLTQDPDARLRSDAAHWLALIGDLRARPILERLLEDTDPEVREIANEGLAELQGHRPG